ncbi:MAG: PilN domain-containing protein [Idiomarina sp.]|nr:PilN domain-containing protein [Idiomarina sp.]
MKHSINLFQADLIPEQPWLTLPRILFVILLLIVALVAAKGVMSWQVSGLQSELATATAQRANAQQQITQLGGQLAAIRPDARLQAEVLRLEAEVLTRQRLLAELQRRGQLDQHDYASLLSDLARLHRDGLWLTRIQQRQGSVILHGKAVDASLLPLWMQQFKTAATLSASRFNMVELKRDDQDILNFILQGTPASASRLVIPVGELNGDELESNGDRRPLPIGAEQ